ncbi:MAG: hypothetical protein M3512_06970 [Bacteroidota bacterium]|nr:hypothetical protein [Bacteroidota bacterium]
MNKHIIDLLNLGCQVVFDKSTRPGNYILVRIIFKEKDKEKSHTSESTISVNDMNDISLANLFFIETKNKFLEKLYS